MSHAARSGTTLLAVKASRQHEDLVQRTASLQQIDRPTGRHNVVRLGTRIREDLLKAKRAEYGKKIVQAVAGQLTAEFGRGWSRTNLFQMVRFAELFPDLRIVQSLAGQLSWTHFMAILYLDDPLKRDFYAEMCRIERWSTRTLEKKIGGMLFERTALSRKPAKLAATELKALRAEDKLTPDLVFRDPYFLDFLGLKDTYAEKDLEAAILREMEAFILELGVGFAFLERQKRVSVDGVDHYLDLLFYHRNLNRLVAVELKLEDFKPGDKRQMWMLFRHGLPVRGLKFRLYYSKPRSAESAGVKGYAENRITRYASDAAQR